MTFDLVSSSWLGTLPRSGEPAELALQDALLNAHLITGLALPSPAMMPAVLRQILLPVVVHALGTPRSLGAWKDWFEQDGFSLEQREKLVVYLDEHRDRFDLLSDQAPFGQVAGLETPKGETKSVALLIPAMASGNNVPVFSCLTEGETLELRPAEAALWLLHAQCWDTAAIKSGAVGDDKMKSGKTTGNPTGPLGQLGVVVPLGRSLYETIVLNLPIDYDGQAALGVPQWAGERVTASWEARPARDLLDLWTWQSRRIRLIATDTPDGLRVTRAVLAAGDRLTQTPSIEPHTAWRHVAKPKAGQAPRYPRRHRPGRSAWQGLNALLTLALPEDADGVSTSLLLRQIGELYAARCLPADYPLRVATYGVEYGNQSAVVEHVMVDEVPLPAAALAADHQDLSQLLLEAVTQADRAAFALDRMLADLRRAAGGEPLPRDKGHRPGEVLLHALDPWMRRLLTGMSRQPDDIDVLEAGMSAWEEVVWRETRRIAGELLAAAPLTAFAGRTKKAEKGEKKDVFRSATADRALTGALYKILPRAAEAEQERQAERNQTSSTSLEEEAPV
ncbi:type I-E CRISPR-associated protein Cse1/CasA [Streptomyces sp. NPDC058052]|uniref:type I-E CRISPR-associated protein Cse1/CasA n=1 Tax=Streptomyces sp. NPDC058052 TaxID=3346316 RepID=UPI0036E67C44